jgi:hypothetical protein
VELDLGVRIDKLCAEDFRSLCFFKFKSMGNTKVLLKPQNQDDSICDILSSECTIDDYHHRGIWSKVVEIDGQRAIGIVSIDRYSHTDMDGSRAYSYSLKGEIIGDKGLEAKLNISTDDLNNLNSLELEGDIRVIGREKYQASLRIGKPISLCTPQPDSNGDTDPNYCDTFPVPTPDIPAPETSNKSNTTIDLVLGTLK